MSIYKNIKTKDMNLNIFLAFLKECKIGYNKKFDEYGYFSEKYNVLFILVDPQIETSNELDELDENDLIVILNSIWEECPDRIYISDIDSTVEEFTAVFDNYKDYEIFEKKFVI